MSFITGRLFKSKISLTSKEANLLLGLVVALAAALRLVHLDALPIGFSHQSLDHHIQVTFKFLKTFNCWFDSEPCASTFPTFVQQYGFASFLHALVFYLWGVGYYQSAILGVALGILSVFIIWKIGKLLLGQEYGLVLALLLAISLWHITFSRHSDAEHSLPVLQVLLSIYFALLCAKSPSLINGGILGVIIGSSWYVYATNQVIPLLFIGALPILGLTFRISLRHRVWLAMLIWFLLTSYPAVATSFSKGHFFPIRSTLPETNNYKITDTAELVRALGRSFNQIFIHSEDEWFVRAGGATTLLGKMLGICGLGVLLSRMRSGLGMLQGVYVLGAFVIGLIPALLSAEQALRRELVGLVVEIFVEGLGALWVLRLFNIFGRMRGVCLAGVFVLLSGWSWSEYAYRVRIPEVNNNRFYRSFATLVERFAKSTPVTVVSTNVTSGGMAKMHVEFAMTEQKRADGVVDVSNYVTFQTFDEVTRSVDCRALCHPGGRIVMLEAILRSPMEEYFQNCASAKDIKINTVTDFKGNPLVLYLQCG